MIKLLISIPIIGIIINNIIPRLDKEKERIIGMMSTIITLYIILIIYLRYNPGINEYQFRDNIDLGIINIGLGIDGISINILLIITMIIPITMLIKENKEIKGVINILLLIEGILIIIFTTLDILVFFIMFELILIPMFIIIGRYGSRINKIEASYRFMIYTMIGSLIMLISIIYLYIKFGTTNNDILNIKINNIYYSEEFYILKYLWIGIFISFLIKIPIFPLHTWLPMAHSEAPTIGSIILAAILLKLGTYGIFRYSLNLFNPLIPEFNGIYNSFLPIIYILSILSIIYCSLTAIRNTDLKQIIAYSSIVHMNFSIFGLFSNNLLGLFGANYLNFSHAFISSALFLLIGILYKRYHSRNIFYYKGLIFTMPLFSFFFFFFSLANISFPFTSAFLSEIFILLSTFNFNLFISILLSSSLIFSSSFIMWLNNRILFSSPSYGGVHSYGVSPSNSFIKSLDLSFNEFLALFPMAFFTLFFGLFPNPLIQLFSLPSLILI